MTLTSYTYDPLGHLSNETRNGSYPINQNYTVDPVGNRTLYTNGGTGQNTFDADDEMTGQTGSATFVLGYNGNGDRASETFNGQGTTYGYDYDDQLTSITKPGTTVSYQYDALGRQVLKSVNGTVTGIYYDGGSVLFENGATPTLQYTWGNGLIRCNGEYPLSDGRGNTRQTTNTSQVATSANEPDSFGVSSYTSGSASPYWYGANSGYRGEGISPAGLPSWGALMKVGAREYDSLLGVFLTRDTDLSQSPYAYCNGDPVNYTDPSGHDARGDTLTGLGIILATVLWIALGGAVALAAAPLGLLLLAGALYVGIVALTADSAVNAVKEEAAAGKSVANAPDFNGGGARSGSAGLPSGTLPGTGYELWSKGANGVWHDSGPTTPQPGQPILSSPPNPHD